MLIVMSLFSFRWQYGYSGTSVAVVFVNGVSWVGVGGTGQRPFGLGFVCFDNQSVSLPLLPGYRRHARGIAFIIPLWIPLLVVAVPPVIAWRHTRRLSKGHCRQCGYNLTGNVSGICPECGTRFREAGGREPTP
jgi:hypothetical protein